MNKKWIAAAMSVIAALGLTACKQESGPAVYVQPVSEIVPAGSVGLNDRFAGMVVSEHVEEIQRDSDRKIDELYVRQGQEVRQGDTLFSYDSEALKLELEKEQLNLEQMKNEVSTLKTQIADLQREMKNASKDKQLEYKIQIQTYQADQKQKEYEITAKQKDIARLKETVANVNVIAPVDGLIQSINENGTDSNGNPAAYITILQSGAYRIKGTLNELNRGAISEGTVMRIISRQDPAQTWSGVVTSIDWDNASQGDPSSSYFYGYGVSDAMGTSSNYPFYVELDSNEGLILGQHVYMELASAGTESGLMLPSYYILGLPEDGTDGTETTDDALAYVWAAGKKDKLEKRMLTLGEYDPITDCYPVLDGLTMEDKIAFPTEACHAGAKISLQPVEETLPENGGNDVYQPDAGVDDMMPDAGMIDVSPDAGNEAGQADAANDLQGG